jgi:hypothetical protein
MTTAIIPLFFIPLAMPCFPMKRRFSARPQLPTRLSALPSRVSCFASNRSPPDECMPHRCVI